MCKIPLLVFTSFRFSFYHLLLLLELCIVFLRADVCSCCGSSSLNACCTFYTLKKEFFYSVYNLPGGARDRLVSIYIKESLKE